MNKYKATILIILLIILFAVPLYLSERTLNPEEISANNETCAIIDNFQLSGNAQTEDLQSDVKSESDIEYFSINFLELWADFVPPVVDQLYREGCKKMLLYLVLKEPLKITAGLFFQPFIMKGANQYDRWIYHILFEDVNTLL